MKPSPRLVLDTCSDLFEKLKFDFEEFKGDNSTYRAFNFVVTAWHLYNDWIDAIGSTNAQEKKRSLEKCRSGHAILLVNIMRDITNATKHWELDSKSKAKQIVDSVSTPIIGDWSAYFLHGPTIYICVKGTNFGSVEVFSAAIKLFDWMLNDSIIEPSLPNELDLQLKDLFERS